ELAKAEIGIEADEKALQQVHRQLAETIENGLPEIGLMEESTRFRVMPGMKIPGRGDGDQALQPALATERRGNSECAAHAIARKMERRLWILLGGEIQHRQYPLADIGGDVKAALRFSRRAPVDHERMQAAAR